MFPPGVSPTPMEQPGYVGIGKYQKLAEITERPTFGGVLYITFLEVRQSPGATLAHNDVPGFVYAVQGFHTMSRNDGERASAIGEGTAGWITAETQHLNVGTAETVWYFISLRSITQRGAAFPYDRYRVLYASPDLVTAIGDKSLVQQLGLITMDPGGRTSAHSHGGSESFYVMKGTVELAVNDGTRTRIVAGQGGTVKPGANMQLRVIGTEPATILTYFVTPEGAPWQTNLQTVP